MTITQLPLREKRDLGRLGPLVKLGKFGGKRSLL
jgi:hypothetical protein